MINYLTSFTYNSPNGATNCSSPCQDQVMGYYDHTLNEFILNRVDIDYQGSLAAPSCNANNVDILFILESPHKKEYNSCSATGPAFGGTGTRFSKYLIKALKNNYSHFLTSDFTVVLINSVQFQCSNGQTLYNSYSNKKNRDLNWIYTHSVTINDLIARINAIKPKLIFNLCTVGIKDLKNILQNSLISNGINPILGDHPSTWNGKTTL